MIGAGRWVDQRQRDPDCSMNPKNIQHSTPNLQPARELEALGRWKLNVECFLCFLWISKRRNNPWRLDESRCAGVPPAGSPSVSPGVVTGSETPPERAAEDCCGTVALVHGPKVHPILEVEVFHGSPSGKFVSSEPALTPRGGDSLSPPTQHSACSMIL